MSSDIMTIQLHEVRIHGYHGIYEEEKKLGNTFIVNLSLDFIAPHKGITSIDETIDYVKVYELVKLRMQTPTPLLETLVSDIANIIFKQFPIVNNIKLQITKAQVYIKTLEGNMSVTVTKKRN
jgi:dihydroneopterin aldolase